MLDVLELAWLIPASPFMGACFIAILLVSFNRTMNRLSKPVTFILFLSIGLSILISYLILAKEWNNEVFKDFNLNIDGIGNFGFHFNFFIDKISALFLASFTTLFLLIIIVIRNRLAGKKRFVFYITSIVLAGSISLVLPLTSFAHEILKDISF